MPTKKCPYCAEEIQEEAIKCKHCGSWLAAPSGSTASACPPDQEAASRWRLFRPTQERMITGVCAGIAYYLGLDPTVVRLVFALTTFFTAILPGIFVYFMLTFLIPSEASLAA